MLWRAMGSPPLVRMGVRSDRSPIALIAKIASFLVTGESLSVATTRSASTGRSGENCWRNCSPSCSILGRGIGLGHPGRDRGLSGLSLESAAGVGDDRPGAGKRLLGLIDGELEVAVRGMDGERGGLRGRLTRAPAGDSLESHRALRRTIDGHRAPGEVDLQRGRRAGGLVDQDPAFGQLESRGIGRGLGGRPQVRLPDQRDRGLRDHDPAAERLEREEAVRGGQRRAVADSLPFPLVAIEPQRDAVHLVDDADGPVGHGTSRDSFGFEGACRPWLSCPHASAAGAGLAAQRRCLPGESHRWATAARRGWPRRSR